MSTTNLFVELLVIGVGAACWVLLVLGGAVPLQEIPAPWLRSYPLLLVSLAFLYVFGIITDRMADWTFDRLFSGGIRARFFDSKRAYQDARRLVLSSSPRLADQHEYGRTRIRISRGWALNSVLCAFVLAMHSLRLPEHSPYTAETALSGSIVFLGLAISAWWSWRLLVNFEYLKIREHAEFLRNEPLLKLHRAA
ncbi:MAG: hypothetical protein ACK5Q5_04450 [Planctomycetaceae bacterium]